MEIAAFSRFDRALSLKQQFDPVEPAELLKSRHLPVSLRILAFD